MFTMAARSQDVWSGEMVAVDVDGVPVVLVNVGGEVRAFLDRCAHQRFPLSRGRLDGGIITCGAHEWQYDACTGRGLNPREAALRTVPVEVRDGAIWVDVARGG